MAKGVCMLENSLLVITDFHYGRLLRWLSGENLSGSGCDLTLSRLRIRGECLCSPY